MQDSHRDVCQSCGRLLAEKAAERGGPFGRPGQTYCSECYAEGRFLDPNLAEGDMIERATDVMVRRGAPPAQARAHAERLISALARWSGLGLGRNRARALSKSMRTAELPT